MAIVSYVCMYKLHVQSCSCSNHGPIFCGLSSARRRNVQKNLTIVSISHDINAACEQSSRILAMKDGASLFIEKPENILTSDKLQSLYQTPFAITDHPVRDGKMAFIKETT